VTKILLTGLLATLLMDGWSLARRYLLASPSLNYALVGRWIVWMSKGRYFHHTIYDTPAVKGETVAGWAVHYLTGMAFAFIPLLLQGRQWSEHPDLLSALMSGFISLVAPFFIMQPALGWGIAASKTPAPGKARLNSAMTHLIYGLGLYLSAVALQALA